jgi:hypothetical protein
MASPAGESDTMLSDCSDGQIQGKQNMRYWLLVILLNALFYLIVKHAAPEWHGTTGYYAGLIICTLIAMVITWRDPPGWFDKSCSA